MVFSPLKKIIWIFLFVFSVGFCFGETQDSVFADTPQNNGAPAFIRWPFNHIIQPFLNGLIYPIATPIDYAFKNGIVEKSVELITFGEKRNIMIYPSFNFKPGAQTLVGFNYRHRNILLDKDYFVFQGNYFANGDLDVSARYSKHALFGTPLFGALRYNFEFDRDNKFVLPETKKSFLEPDSSFSFEFKLGSPLGKNIPLNAEIFTAIKFNRFSSPDIIDSVLISDVYPISDRGLYQNFMQVPLGISLSFDNLDFAYAPSKGSRFVVTGAYNFVSDYGGIDGEDLGLEEHISDGGLNHDYVSSELMFQHYLYFGQTKNYILSVKEARKNRKFYTDFSWDEAVRIWKPDQVWNTLFERRVIAMQYRLVSIWEVEKGGAPHNGFPTLNARTPLRGYGDSWATHHLMSFSMEYRWPVDRFVDGVLFDEYALIAPKIDKWDFDHYYNSWGFGIRVRMPNMYLLRLQFGFHGLHGVNLVMTIAPEFR